MKASTIRFVDRWLGIPACALLTLFRRLFDWRRPVDPIRRVLVLKLVEQGATVIAYPALRALSERVGRENVFFMVLEENRAILDLLDVVPAENVIVVPRGGVVRTFAGILRGILRARCERIDTVVDFEFFARSSAVMAYVTGASRRAGYHSYHGDGPWRGDLMTHRLLYNPHHHALYAFLLLVEALWQNANSLPALNIELTSLDASLMRFSPTVAESEEVARMLRGCTRGVDPRPLVLLNANASDLIPLRKWHDGRYVELARRLVGERQDVFVAFTGSPSEAAVIDALVSDVDHPRCFSLAGRTTMRQLLVLYALADVLVSNDSGPGHFAALTDIDIVTLVGPETPKVWGVLGPHAHRVSVDLPCSPCVSIYNNRLSSCRNNICMQGITVEMVYQKVVQLLAARRRLPPA